MKPLRLALAVCVLLASSLGTEGALAGDGGKKTGQTCHKGLYVNYVDPSTALAFTSESDCTSSLAQTGAVYSISTARCFDPTWKLIKDSSDGSATSGVSCATFVQGGGSLAGTRIVTTGSTVSFTYTFEAFNVITQTGAIPSGSTCVAEAGATGLLCFPFGLFGFDPAAVPPPYTVSVSGTNDCTPFPPVVYRDRQVWWIYTTVGGHRVQDGAFCQSGPIPSSL